MALSYCRYGMPTLYCIMWLRLQTTLPICSLRIAGVFCSQIQKQKYVCPNMEVFNDQILLFGGKYEFCDLKLCTFLYMKRWP